MSWARFHLPNDVYHVVPVADLKLHDEDGVRCWCNPRVERQDSGGKLVVHNSADGREFHEIEEQGH